MPKRATIQDVINFLEKNANNQCTLLSKEYINTATPLLFKCNNCGKEFERDFAHLKRGRFLCETCSREKAVKTRSFTIEDVREYLEKNDLKHECILLSEDYKNNQTPLTLQCTVCGKIFQRDFQHIKRGRFRCETCGEIAGAKKLVYTKEDVQKDIAKDGYTMIGEYQKADIGVLCQCGLGHKPFLLFYSEYKIRRRGCPECGKLKISGENHWNWQGGVSDIGDLMRDAADPWKYNCFNTQHCCDVTGSKENLVVHHLTTNFAAIVKQAMENTNFQYKGKQLKDYSQDEITNLKEEIARLHENVEGVVLNKEVHNLFHSTYGKVNNTPEQYFEFKEKIQKGEIDLNGIIRK